MTLVTRPMLAINTQPHKGLVHRFGKQPVPLTEICANCEQKVITTQPHNFFRSSTLKTINANCDSVTTVFSECCDWEKNELNNWLFLMKHIKSIFQ